MTGEIMRVAAAIFLATAVHGQSAQAEVVSSGPNGFHVRQSVQIVIPQDAAFSTFGQVSSWWNPEHTYGGKAESLSLSLQPGGCFCERFPTGGGIEHMRVTYVDPGKRLILTGSLGPLLHEATTGVLDMKFDRIAGGTKVMMDYKVSGFANGGAEKLAAAVDAVLAEQFKRYREYARKPRPQN
ncbi:ATPase [Sphingomonas daechungensis]|uniref:ATPase n=1 Tax=Sphingomonas daechungensis TaxID=1176646 RepID=A0ABX6T236_9SPHN|nr:ATPase [Sphingomonas daechungensis]QNP43599.1 ATPase [Sphingomonas daechungensis]